MRFFRPKYKKLDSDIKPLVFIESIINPSDTLSEAIEKGIQYLLDRPAKNSCAIYKSLEYIYILKQDTNKIDLYFYNI